MHGLTRTLGGGGEAKDNCKDVKIKGGRGGKDAKEERSQRKRGDGGHIREGEGSRETMRTSGL